MRQATIQRTPPSKTVENPLIFLEKVSSVCKKCSLKGNPTSFEVIQVEDPENVVFHHIQSVRHNIDDLIKVWCHALYVSDK